MHKTWQEFQDKLFLRDTSTQQDILQNRIYGIQMTDKQELFLVKREEEFKFDFKVYGMESEFIDQVLKTYANTTGNLGVLLNGVKGTGKTITAELLANKLKLPIILIDQVYPGINTFLSEFPQDICILIDEYEKVYKATNIETYDEYGDRETKTIADSSLLGLMDGTLKTDFRKVFILTTNKLWLNENMLNRPGRIRYKKTFEDLTADQTKEILDDCLLRTEFREDIIDFLKPLSLITVDIVKSIVSEVNIHDKSPQYCCKDFNVEIQKEKYNMIRVDINNNGHKEVLEEEIDVDYMNQFLKSVRVSWKSARLHTSNAMYQIAEAPKPGKEVYKMYNASYDTAEDAVTVRFEKAKLVHKSVVF